ncbi:hypothetical protein GLOTRDRAFT_135851 [Gloeophyllum trabeum ATCC 11539]|uniref:Uncharacterized protein n=1 Tax=Gloeophyllum trabeum (strain ATCC 11539 / FP-39264 / Madison 617) TaxID=670483 RepID=S7QFY5_GLOTA|nr:uncharacterized protein GLOTRDRAFT_135851 [Gloeophyllum trabeum ATCC 11539]EPQ58786.1 hypothetical protein GLOTRDRAFT_135851 [Gloeophyllum trabeum ATCC 11539]
MLRSRGTPTLSDLPVELLEQIFLEACHDGGRTACALRLVCRGARALVEPYRFVSVALSSSAQMEELLRSRGSIARGRGIRHLFLVESKSREENECVRSEIVEEIIRIAAPTVETLTCLVRSVSNAFPNHWILRTPFPRLTHLTCELVQMDVQVLIIQHPPVAPCYFPALQYLHVSFPAKSSLDLECAHPGVGLFVDRASPALTHVRVSGVNIAGPHVPALRVILGLQPRGTRRIQGYIRALPASVKSYTIGVTTFCWGDARAAEEPHPKADAVRAEAEHAGRTRLVLLPVGKLESTWQESRERWMKVQSGELAQEAEWVESGIVGRKRSKSRFRKVD